AMVVGSAAIEGRQCELAVMDFAFMGGSMGSVVGEKLSRACDSAAEAGMPLVSVTSSGGARMQEGILALMQLPKTVAAVEDLRDSGQALLCVMAHPTTGGVLASFATLGDVLLAEPNALMSFAGPRVVQEITREKLPDDFGRAEQNLRYGHIDAIVPRPELRPTLSRLLRLFDAPNGARAAAAAAPRAVEEPAAAGRREAVRGARAARAAIVPDRGGGPRRGDLAQGRARPTRRAAVHARLRRAAARRLVRA